MTLNVSASCLHTYSKTLEEVHRGVLPNAQTYKPALHKYFQRGLPLLPLPWLVFLTTGAAALELPCTIACQYRNVSSLPTPPRLQALNTNKEWKDTRPLNNFTIYSSAFAPFLHPAIHSPPPTRPPCSPEDGRHPPTCPDPTANRLSVAAATAAATFDAADRQGRRHPSHCAEHDEKSHHRG